MNLVEVIFITVRGRHRRLALWAKYLAIINHDLLDLLKDHKEDRLYDLMVYHFNNDHLVENGPVLWAICLISNIIYRKIATRRASLTE